MALGTRCQQLAIVPSSTRARCRCFRTVRQITKREPESLEFLRAVPSTWDDTVPLDGKIAEYVAVARRSGKDWYVGAMSNWTARDLEIDLSFLPSGNFTMDAFQDGLNADRMASDYKKTINHRDEGHELKVHLAPGGGWAARIHP